MIDTAFGNWFAGFTDGEGSFNIAPVKGGRTRQYCYGCRFQIHLRDDDSLILYEAKEKLGVGDVYHASPRRNNPALTVFQVNKKEDCLILRDIFTQFPLRAKKAQDFKIWSEALDCWLAHKRGDSWDNMILLKKELESSREYREASQYRHRDDPSSCLHLGPENSVRPSR